MSNRLLARRHAARVIFRLSRIVGVVHSHPDRMNADQILGGCTSFTGRSSSVTLFLNIVSNHLANTRYCVIKRPTLFSELGAIFSQSSLVDLVSPQKQQVLCRRPLGRISTSPRRAGGRSAHVCVIRSSEQREKTVSLFRPADHFIRNKIPAFSGTGH